MKTVTSTRRIEAFEPPRWYARVISGLAVLFLLFDATLKVLKVPAAVDGTTQLGYPDSVIVPLGVLQLICLAIYLMPRTSVLGAILWTGYLGGAIATHVRVGSPLFTHVLFPIYVAVLLWGALWLRDDRVRALLPLRAIRSARDTSSDEGVGAPVARKVS
jgi:DoxX-like family